MSRTKKNWIIVLSLNLLPLSLAATSGIFETFENGLVAQGTCESSGRAPASAVDEAANKDLTDEERQKLRFQVDHCGKTHQELDVAGNALKILMENNPYEYNNKELEKIVRRLDGRSASIDLAGFRKQIEESSEKTDLDDVRDSLMDWASDKENLKMAKDEDMSGADKVAVLLKDIAAKYGEILRDSPRKSKTMIGALERALRINGLSRVMSQEIRNDIANYRREDLMAVAQGGMLNNPQFMISYMEAMNSIQTDMAKSCTGWGIETMTSCRAAQNQLTSMQQIPMIAQRADTQKQQMLQQQQQIMQKMFDQSYQVMNQNMTQLQQTSSNTNSNYSPYVNPLVANPGSLAPAVTGTGRNWF